jgi:hypothetical protein
MLDTLKMGSFEPHMGSGFTIDTPDHKEVLTLVEVTAGKQQTEERRSFSVLFRGSSNETLIHSQLVSLDHPEMGRLDIMISPVSRNDDGTFNYEAVFN